MIPRMRDAPRIVRVDPDDPDSRTLELACGVLGAGGIVALPTETFYGLAADPWSAAGVAAIFRAKGRASDAALLLLLEGTEQAARVARILPPAFGALAARYWPGPLTLVVAARDDVPREVTGGGATIGVRVPGLVLPRALARAMRGPVTGTSANVSGGPPARTAAELPAALGDGYDALGLVLDGGETPGGAP